MCGVPKRGGVRGSSLGAVDLPGHRGAGPQLLEVGDVVVERPRGDAQEFGDGGDGVLGVQEHVAGGTVAPDEQAVVACAEARP